MELRAVLVCSLVSTPLLPACCRNTAHNSLQKSGKKTTQIVLMVNIYSYNNIYLYYMLSMPLLSACCRNTAHNCTNRVCIFKCQHIVRLCNLFSPNTNKTQIKHKKANTHNNKQNATNSSRVICYPTNFRKFQKISD